MGFRKVFGRVLESILELGGIYESNTKNKFCIYTQNTNSSVSTSREPEYDIFLVCTRSRPILVSTRLAVWRVTGYFFGNEITGLWRWTLNLSNAEKRNVSHLGPVFHTAVFCKQRYEYICVAAIAEIQWCNWRTATSFSLKTNFFGDLCQNQH